MGLVQKKFSPVDSAQSEGIDIVHDLYPYTASSTSSSVLFPQWSLAGGPDAFKDRINDPETRAQIEYEMIDIFKKEELAGI